MFTAKTQLLSFAHAPLTGNKPHTVAVNIRNNGSGTTYFLLKDHLGSIMKVITASGTTIEEHSYDAWGNHRKPANWDTLTFSSTLGINRGYTGHEMLPMFQLINMNGRMYDPVIGRMLAPDNYVADATNAQDFNRYSYVRNNPLKYIDPSGEKAKWWQWGLGALGFVDPGTILATTTTTAAITAFNATVPLIAATTGIPFMVSNPVSSLMAIGSTLYTGATITALSASLTSSAVDFNAIIWRTLIKNDTRWGGKLFENWAKLELGRLGPIASMFSYDNHSASGFEWPMQVINNIVGGEFLQDHIGNTFGHIQNIGEKIDAIGYYGGRTTIRLKDGYVGENMFSGISFGHYVFGYNMALSPGDDAKYDHDLFAHEYGHTYQSRIMGPLYLFRVGISSAIFGSMATEGDATRRGSSNLGITIQDTYRFPSGTSTYKWWEWGFAPMLWPFMWSWNH